jgi:hypothetical protein
VAGGLGDIFFGQVDEALHLTALGAAGLAGESESIHCLFVRVYALAS